MHSDKVKNNTVSKTKNGKMKFKQNDFTGEKMKIAICDNEQVIVNKIASLLEDYLHLHNYDVTYETFSSYEGLKDKIKEIDLFLLDHNMNDDTINPDDSDLMTGMQFAQVIREIGGEHKGIIFMTSYNDLKCDLSDLKFIFKQKRLPHFVRETAP